MRNTAPEPMPHNICPMLATPADKPFDDPAWLYEVKWDGYRIIAEIAEKGVSLYSRNLKPYTALFPGIADDLLGMRDTAVLDGEIVALDERGHPSFELLQQHLRTHQGLTVYYVFDILYLNGELLMEKSLIERKELLKLVLPPGPRIRYGDHIVGKGKALFSLIRGQELEGMVAKKSTSKYYPGVRSSEWLKIKTVREQDAVICGYTKSMKDAHIFSSLVLGIYDQGSLVYIGKVGVGFNEEIYSQLMMYFERLKISTSPLEAVPDKEDDVIIQWVRPELVCRIHFSEWTHDGKVRHARFHGLRFDISSQEVMKEARSRGVPQIRREEAHIPVVKISNQEKVLWPQEGYTKGSLITYYETIADVILPHLRDRPLNLHRFSEGIAGEDDWQKNISDVPSWIETVAVMSEGERQIVTHIICQRTETLAYLVNAGCIDVHPWISRIPTLEQPDAVVLGLDPCSVSFASVIEVAQTIRKVLEHLELESYCKTSGGKGLHIYIPFPPRYSFDQTHMFAELLARLVSIHLRDKISLTLDPVKREGTVYIDYVQNRWGQTTVAPYCVRPFHGAPISTPVKWSEVDYRLDPSQFTLKTIDRRLDRVGDLWSLMHVTANDFGSALDKIEHIYLRDASQHMVNE